MVKLTDKEVQLVSSALKEYTNSESGRLHAIYCNRGYEELQTIIEKLETKRQTNLDGKWVV